MRFRRGWILPVVLLLGVVWWVGQRTAREEPVEAVHGEAVTGATPAPFEREAFATIAADRGILVHCGNSMRPAVEDLAAEFQRRTGMAVRLSFGGSAELLATIELGRQGEVYVCHDPYAELLDGKGLLAEVAVVGALTPILVVPAGNPHGLSALHDVVAPGVRVAMPDARFATAGKLVRAAARDAGLEEALDANLIMEGRGHNDVALAVLSGQADAGIVWNFIASFYRGRLEQVGLGLPVPETQATVCLLTAAADGEAARRFLDLARSDFGRKVFTYHGYR